MDYLHQAGQFLKTTTARLAGSYLAIIMLMSIGFSIVFYNASSHELGRQVPPPGAFGVERYDQFRGPGPRLDYFFEQRIAEGRHALLTRLIYLNTLALIAGSLVSYYLARRTLEPIEANMEAQSQFVSDASHELRTPLTALQTTNEVALRKSSVSSKEAKEIFGHNVAEVVKLRQLTDSLLKLAKNGNGGHTLAPVPLGDVVSDAMNAVVNSALEKKISIEDKVPKMSVLADKPSITQALVTILDNAVKYSPAKSTIYVSASKQGKYAILVVKDEGIGIKPEHLPHIFDRFYRADVSRNKQHNEGFGIGLALAKKIIEQHDGEIIAESKHGKGSTFILKIPLS